MESAIGNKNKKRRKTQEISNGVSNIESRVPEYRVIENK
jgi:hypothetical protein